MEGKGRLVLEGCRQAVTPQPARPRRNNFSLHRNLCRSSFRKSRCRKKSSGCKNSSSTDVVSSGEKDESCCKDSARNCSLVQAKLSRLLDGDVLDLKCRTAAAKWGCQLAQAALHEGESRLDTQTAVATLGFSCLQAVVAPAAHRLGLHCKTLISTWLPKQLHTQNLLEVEKKHEYESWCQYYWYRKW